MICIDSQKLGYSFYTVYSGAMRSVNQLLPEEPSTTAKQLACATEAKVRSGSHMRALGTQLNNIVKSWLDCRYEHKLCYIDWSAAALAALATLGTYTNRLPSSRAEHVAVLIQPGCIGYFLQPVLMINVWSLSEHGVRCQ